MARTSRGGLRAPPKAMPWWLRVARGFLYGLRHKDPTAYRAMRGRVFEAWRDLVPVWKRLTAAALGEPGGQYLTETDAGRLCAAVLEIFAWWAADERFEVAPIREAERELLELQDRIRAAADELCAAVARTEELCERLGLRVEVPHWNNDLTEVLGETARRFGRWGLEPTVRALLESERRSFYVGRPRLTDLVRVAQEAGLLRTDRGEVVRTLGHLVRTHEPSVVPIEGNSAEALRSSKGSKATSEAAQLRQLFSSMRELALNEGWNTATAGPLVWLSDLDISTLCRVLAGNGKPPSKARPWGEPSEGFDLETVRKARRAFILAEGGKPGR